MKRLLAILLGAVLVFGSLEATSYAGKGASSGGRSFSGGSRSYGGSVGGRSYSGGTKPIAGSGGKSYTSGFKTPTVTTAPKTTTSGKSYSSGSKTYTPAPQNQSKPKGGVFDGGAAAAQQRAASKTNYVRGSEPRSTYTTPAGKTATIDNSSRSVQNIRSMSRTAYITRETRIHTFYGGYYGYPVVVYHDPYNSFFWYWLLDRSLEDRALWAYHHRPNIDSASMDSARYQALLAKDAQLEGRIRQLEAEKRAVDSAYTPTGMEYDLQFTDDYVDSIYNPHTEFVHRGWFGRLMWWTFMTLLTVTVFCVVIYLIFIKRWGG